ncbi:hypothetical protein ACFOPQ_06090 [Deinococcus antarcticus]|uniref:DUF1579 domain-containing protein n=1 Tax=Deinococcus antarcticus TaxID=1298767 RepID=A0ABV8A7B7_9DEIO
MSNDTTPQLQQPPQPNPDLEPLNRLVGTWRLSGDTAGTTTYEWMEGGFFLMQHVEFEENERKTRGLEIIGHEQKYGEAPSEDIKSRYYSGGGETLEYVYELKGDTLTIWSGWRDSPAYYQGTFSADGNVLDGRWVYPGGGGYTTIATRVK